MNEKKEKSREFFEITSLRGDPKGTLKKCVFLPDECLEPYTYAHSISRSKILVPMAGSSDILYEFDLYPSMDLSDDPHKLMIDSKWFKITPREASTFPGLCNEHDRIFKKIDNKVPRSDDREGLFLLAYRTIIHSYWMILDSLNKSAMLGEDIENSQRSNTIYLRNLRNTEANLLKEMYKHYSAGDWDFLEHKFITFENHSPTIAANSLRDLSDSSQQFFVPFVINIFPVCQNTVCVFSYPKSHKELMKGPFSDLLKNNNTIIKREITLIIMRESNVMLFSPKYFLSLNNDQKLEIRNMFYLANLLQQGEINSLPEINWHLF